MPVAPELDEGSCVRVHLPRLPQCPRCVLGIPAGPRLPALYLRHLSGISHPSAEAPGSEGSGQALFPPDWLDRSRVPGAVPFKVAAWGRRIPGARTRTERG